MTESTHQFGGAWTQAKLAALENYLRTYATALKSSGFRLTYIDAFAGTGTFVPTGESGENERLGSAAIALRVPGFTDFYFIEQNPDYCRELRKLQQAANPDQNVQILEGDANAHLRALCLELSWKSRRAVLFLDPYGMQVDWGTLEDIRRTQAIDVWYLFPLSAVTRQLARDETKIDEAKRKALDRVFGTTEWFSAFYAPWPTPDLFGHEGVFRDSNTKEIVEWINRRMSSLFAKVLPPVILRKGRSGPPLFALYFLLANDSVKAVKLAQRLYNGVLKKLRRERVVV